MSSFLSVTTKADEIQYIGWLGHIIFHGIIDISSSDAHSQLYRNCTHYRPVVCTRFETSVGRAVLPHLSNDSKDPGLQTWGLWMLSFSRFDDGDAARNSQKLEPRVNQLILQWDVLEEAELCLQGQSHWYTVCVRACVSVCSCFSPVNFPNLVSSPAGCQEMSLSSGILSCGSYEGGEVSCSEHRWMHQSQRVQSRNRLVVVPLRWQLVWVQTWSNISRFQRRCS